MHVSNILISLQLLISNDRDAMNMRQRDTHLVCAGNNGGLHFSSQFPTQFLTAAVRNLTARATRDQTDVKTQEPLRDFQVDFQGIVFQVDSKGLGVGVFLKPPNPACMTYGRHVGLER
jgi:hypothetical protein